MPPPSPRATPMLLLCLLWSFLRGGMVSAVAPGTMKWNRPTLPETFTLKATMTVGEMGPEPTTPRHTLRFWVDGDNVGITYPELGAWMHSELQLQKNTRTYMQTYFPSNTLNQTYNCTFVDGDEIGNYEWFLPYWIMDSFRATDTEWIYGGETSELINGKPKVTGVIWIKYGYYYTGVIALYMDGDNLQPVRFEVGGKNTIQSDTTGGSRVVFNVKGFRIGGQDIKDKSVLKKGTYCVPDDAGDADRRRRGRRLTDDGIPPAWEAAQIYYETESLGVQVAQNQTVEQFHELFTNCEVNYTMRPIDASQWSGYTVGGIYVVKNQKTCGDCWAFSATTVLETAVFMQSKETISSTLSVQYFTDCVPFMPEYDGWPKNGQAAGGCHGGWPWMAWDFLIRTGGLMPLESEQPFAGMQGKCRPPVGGFQTGIKSYTLLKTVAEVKNALVNLGGVSIAIDATTWMSKWGYDNGHSISDYANQGLAWTWCSPSLNFNHAVTLIGWTECKWPEFENGALVGTKNGECWRVLNSWGKDGFGQDGWFLIPIMEPGVAAGNFSDCGVLNTNPDFHFAFTFAPILDLEPY